MYVWVGCLHLRGAARTVEVVLHTASLLPAVGESIGEAIRAGYAAAGLGEARCWENLPTSQQGPQQIHKYTFRPTMLVLSIDSSFDSFDTRHFTE